MIVNRVIDNAAVTAASLTRTPPSPPARRRSRTRTPVRGTAPRSSGCTPTRASAPSGPPGPTASPCASSTTTTRSSPPTTRHPGDNIPPLVAVAQHTGRSGADLVRAIATGYEIQVDLVRAISLHAHKIDHVAHLGPSVAAGLGTLLDLSPEVIFHAVGQALHTTTATRQSRKGEISTWKAYAPAFAGKVAIEAVDRAMRGETSPDARSTRARTA